MSAVLSDAFLSELEATRARYEERASDRERIRSLLTSKGILRADAPRRVTQRLARLNSDWTLARALEQTPAGPTIGRSLETLRPESFGADVLGLERLMGRNDLVDVGFLEAGYLASRAVGRITASGAYGTGFLVSPRLVLTNNHVLRSAEEAGQGFIEFNYQAGLDGRALDPVAFTLAPERLFETSRELDFTLVAVQEPTSDGELSSFGHLPLIASEGKVLLGELVNIIQHPNGEPKQLALRENRIVDLLERFLHYETDTEPGSSGSPVFNDQWEVVALHHSGVPKTDDQGRYLAVDGSVWTRDMGEHRLAWKANEGVRVSRILEHLRTRPLTGPAADLRSELFAEANRPSAPGRGATATHGAPEPAGAGAGRSHVADLLVPLRVTVSLGFPLAASPPPLTRAGAVPAVPLAIAQATDDRELRAALVAVEAARGRPYHEEEADRQARGRYYQDIDDSDGTALYRSLNKLLERTHEPRPPYKPMRHVYPWLDLHPDGVLRSIYSGKTFAAEELVRADAQVEAARTSRFTELLRTESALGPSELEAQFDALEAALPFNCEHVVPQSWFAKREPMRGDLHHLFACESGCNSFRGNFPYFDFADREELVRAECGRREEPGFEPAAGKGPVARATLYFLLRYPGLVGDSEQELPPERLELLLRWHEQDPVSEYELHRNVAVAEIQGNRNPFIDHPGWVGSIDFEGAWA